MLDAAADILVRVKDLGDASKSDLVRAGAAERECVGRPSPLMGGVRASGEPTDRQHH